MDYKVTTNIVGHFDMTHFFISLKVTDNNNM